MARPRSIYSCTHCGAQQPRWLGRCPECSKFGTLEEELVGAGSRDEAPAGESRDLLQRERIGDAPKPRPLESIEPLDLPRIRSGIGELDRVLGGGFVPGSVVLLGGEPGIGKSTLALQLACQIEAQGRNAKSGGVLYISGEESPEQVRLRAERLPEIGSGVSLLAETRVEAFADAWRELAPTLVIIDSVQTLSTSRVDSAPGSVAQVRESAALLAATAKRNDTTLVMIGHVTKDGSLAGPRVLEHLVDVVLGFEGDRQHAFRLLRASKNRFGSTQEVGVFTMGEEGLAGVDNPSELFLAERSNTAPGSCVIPMLEGKRPMLVELQALVAPAPYGTPRRTTIGVEDARVALILAVLDRRSNVDLLSSDIYVNAVGGVKVAEPAADLGVALAIASSALDVPIPPGAAACGEIGLGGEVRRVGNLSARIREAARLGFHELVLPRGAAAEAEGCRVVEVETVVQAVEWLRG